MINPHIDIPERLTIRYEGPIGSLSACFYLDDPDGKPHAIAFTEQMARLIEAAPSMQKQITELKLLLCVSPKHPDIDGIVTAEANFLELKKDEDKLNWLEAQPNLLRTVIAIYEATVTGCTIREAFDAAMKVQP